MADRGSSPSTAPSTGLTGSGLLDASTAEVAACRPGHAVDPPAAVAGSSGASALHREHRGERDFAARVREAGVDPAALVAAVGALGYCEKAALLDLALQAQAPAAAQEEARS